MTASVLVGTILRYTILKRGIGGLFALRIQSAADGSYNIGECLSHYAPELWPLLLTLDPEDEHGDGLDEYSSYDAIYFS
jgi:hypothetical protein